LVRLLINGEIPDIEEIKDQFIMLLAAGTETTGITFAMCLYALAKHTDWQEKLYAELQEVNENEKDSTLKAQANIPKLKYMEAFINEVQRRYTPLPFNLPRQAVKSHYLNQNGLYVMKGFIM
jgi:cytochrome P450